MTEHPDVPVALPVTWYEASAELATPTYDSDEVACILDAWTPQQGPT